MVPSTGGLVTGTVMFGNSLPPPSVGVYVGVPDTITTGGSVTVVEIGGPVMTSVGGVGEGLCKLFN
jgi:hypothetical protein